jgi:hypothetical protein
MTPNGDVPQLPPRPLQESGIPIRDPQYPVADAPVFALLSLGIGLFLSLCLMVQQIVGMVTQ